MENCTIESLSHFVDVVSAIKVDSKPGDRFNIPRLLFRGQSSCSYKLCPSLGRQPNPYWGNTYSIIENKLIQKAQQKFPDLFSSIDYPVFLLAKLQHYGIATRLLDLTANALVALYFSCQGNLEEDGEVFAFSASPLSGYNPKVNAIADAYRLNEGATTTLEMYYYRVMNQKYYARNLYPDWEKNTEVGLNILREDLAQPLFIEVGNICERQKNQNGYFLLFPNRVNEVKNTLIITDELVSFNKSDQSVVARLTIPKEKKVVLKEQLKRFGITEEFLFMDDVDKVCRIIMTDYTQCFMKLIP